MLKFFLVFARFEYAMKAAGWTNSNHERAEPDWRRLINELQNVDEAVTAPLLQAGAYLLDAPPQKQMVLQ